jgi:hypothetical protein
MNCTMGATSHIKDTYIQDSFLSNTQTVVEAGDFYIDNCASAVAGSGSVTFDFGAALNSSNLNVRHHSGGWTIANMGAGTGTYNASFEGNGQIIWAASCSATSNAAIRGNWKITDNASGAVTETLDDNQTAVDAILVDTGTTLPATLGSPAGADLATDIATIDTVVDNLNLGIIYGTVQAGTLSTTQCTTDLSGYADDDLIGRVVVFTGGAADGIASDITDYASSSGLLTFTAVATSPSAGDTFKLV